MEQSTPQWEAASGRWQQVLRRLRWSGLWTALGGQEDGGMYSSQGFGVEELGPAAPEDSGQNTGSSNSQLKAPSEPEGVYGGAKEFLIFFLAIRKIWIKTRLQT